jgi:hypothetical protein
MTCRTDIREQSRVPEGIPRCGKPDSLGSIPLVQKTKRADLSVNPFVVFGGAEGEVSRARMLASREGVPPRGLPQSMREILSLKLPVVRSLSSNGHQRSDRNGLAKLNRREFFGGKFHSAIDKRFF